MSTLGIRTARRLIAITVAAGLASHAAAQMTLTAAGVARNFQLTTFVSGYPSSGGVGPVGLDYQPDGTVLVTEYTTNAIRRFNNVDNQTVTDGALLNYSGAEFPHDVAHVGGTMYISHYSSQTIEQLNADGSVNHVVVSGIGNARAMEVNPTNGHLLVSCAQGIRDVDPIAGTFSALNATEVDGMAISPDGSIIYGSVLSNGPGGHIVGYSTTTGAAVFDSGFVGFGGLDGLVLGFGPFAGYIYANMVNGQVWEVNLTTFEQTLIASGGSRGDFATPDPAGSGDMLITQSDRVLRLHGIPSPSAGAVMLLGVLAMPRRRRA